MLQQKLLEKNWHLFCCDRNCQSQSTENFSVTNANSTSAPAVGEVVPKALGGPATQMCAKGAIEKIKAHEACQTEGCGKYEPHKADETASATDYEKLYQSI
jgi:hypothetical protein